MRGGGGIEGLQIHSLLLHLPLFILLTHTHTHTKKKKNGQNKVVLN